MTRPVFNAEVIDGLRERVIAHNSGSPPEARVRLQELKNVYSRGWRGADPAERALAKVDEFLSGLQKAGFDPGDHPRGSAGRFAAKGGKDDSAPANADASITNLPASRAAHRALARSNAGYRALTSGVVPETRFDALGQAVRDGGAMAAGATLVGSLAAGKPNGIAARTARAIGRGTGRSLGAVPTALGLHAAAATMALADAMRRQPESAIRRLNRHAKANLYMRQAGKIGADIGEKVGDIAWRPPAFVTRSVVDAVRGRATAGLSGRLRAGAAIAGLGIPVGMWISNRIVASPFDPQAAGDLVDNALGYRRVQKMAEGADIGDAFSAMREGLAKGAFLNDLADLKAVIPQDLYSRAGRAVLTTLAGTAGAAAGAGASAAGQYGAHLVGELRGKRGNPYHDAHGRFTSHSNAATIAGAIAGGALAATLAYAGIRAHNRAAIAAAAHKLASITGESGIWGHPDVDPLPGVELRSQAIADFVRRKAEIIREAVERHPAVAEVRATSERLGASAPLHYIRRAREEANTQFADKAAFWDDFKIPQPDGWTSLGDFRGTFSAANVRDTRTRQAVLNFLGKATPEQFGRAIKDLGPEQRQAATEWFAARQTIPDQIVAQLADHHRQLEEARATASATQKGAEAASAREVSAQAALTTAPEEEKEVRAAAAKAAGSEAEKAKKAAAAAEKKLAGLEGNAPTVRSPVTHSVIATPTPQDDQLVLADATNAARVEAERSYERTLKGLNQQRARHAGEQARRGLGALAILGENLGALSRPMREAGKGLARAHRLVNDAQDKLDAAVDLRESTERTLDVAKRALRLAGKGRGKATAAADAAPAAVAAPAAAPAKHPLALFVDRAVRTLTGAPEAPVVPKTAAEVAGEAAEEHKKALSGVAEATATLAQARGLHAKAINAYHKASMEAPRPTGHGSGYLPAGLRDQIRGDLQRALGGPMSAVREFLKEPTASALARFAKLKEGARSLKDDAVHQLFYVRDPETKEWSFSLGRTIGSAGTLALAGEGVKQAARYGYHRFLGPKNKRAAAKLTHHFGFEREVNPVTGAGYVTITAPHPTDRGDRVVLWGERYDNEDQTGKRLAVGGRSSVLRQNFQQGKFNNSNNSNSNSNSDNNTHTGRAFMMDREGTEWKKSGDAIDQKLRQLRGRSGALVYADTGGNGPRVGYRNPTEADGGQEAGQFTRYLRNFYLNKGKLEQPAYGHALKALSSEQAQILQPAQVYRALTNYQANGNKADFQNGIFAPNEAFGSQDKDEVASALRDEIDRVLGQNPDQQTKTNLQRAVQMAAVAKDLPAEQTRQLQEAIRGGKVSFDGKTAMEALPPDREAANAAPAPVPPTWNKDEFDNLIRGHANQVRQQLGGQVTTDQASTVLRALATHAHHRHKLGMRESLDAAASAIRAEANTEPRTASRQAVGAMVRDGDWETAGSLYDELDRQARTQANNGSLRKFDPGEPRMPKGPSAGEWTPRGQSAAAPAAAARPSFLSPGRAVPNIAYNTGMQAGWHLAGKYLPGYKATSDATHAGIASLSGLKSAVSAAVAGGDAGAARAARAAFSAEAGPSLRSAALSIADRVLPGIAGGGAGILRTGAQLVGSAVAGSFVQRAAEAATRFGYRAAGHTPPSFKAPKLNAGESAAQLGGNLAGAAAGSALGSAIAGPPGYYVGDVLGAWLGGEGAARAYDWFKGYEGPRVQRVAQRFAS